MEGFIRQGSNTDQIFGSVIGGGYNLTKTGTNTLTLTQPNTFTGVSRVYNGILRLNNATSASTGSITIGEPSGANNAQLDIAANISIANNIVIASGSTGTATIRDLSTGLPHVTYSGTIQLNKNLILSNSGSAGGDHAFFHGGVISGTGNITIAGGVSGSGTVQRVSLAGVNTFVGSITVPVSNVLQANNDGIPSTADLIINGVCQMGATGVTYTFNSLTGSGSFQATQTGGWNISMGNNNGGGTFSGTFNGGSSTPSLFKNGTGTQILTGISTAVNSVIVNNGILQFGASGAGTFIPVGTPITINAGGQCIWNGSTAQTYTGAIIATGTGRFTKSGTSSFLMNGNQSTATGTYEVTAGVLRFNTLVSSSASAKYIIGAAGTLALNVAATTFNIGELSGSGELGAGGLVTTAASIGALNTSTTFSGNIQNNTGVVSITKEGTGTLTLTGTGSTYSGTTTVNAGTLQLGDGVTTTNIIPSGNTISNLATLIFNTAGTYTRTGIISGTGGFVKEGTGTVILSGANTVTGTITINAGTLQIGDGVAAGAIILSLGVPIVNNGTLIYNKVTNSTQTSNISGAGTIIKNGSFQLSISTTKTFTGDFIINTGTVVSQNTLSLGTTGNIFVNNGGTLTFTANNTGSKVITCNVGGVVNNGGFAHPTTTFINNGGIINP